MSAASPYRALVALACIAHNDEDAVRGSIRLCRAVTLFMGRPWPS